MQFILIYFVTFLSGVIDQVLRHLKILLSIRVSITERSSPSLKDKVRESELQWERERKKDAECAELPF